MKEVLKHSIIVLALLFSKNAFCQDFKEDLERSNNYYNTTNFSSDVEIKVFDFNESTEIQKAQIKKKGDEFLQVVNDRTILTNSKHIIIVDRESKEIIVSSISSKKEKASVIFGTDQIQAITDNADSVSFIGVRKGLKKYELYSSSSAIEKMEIYFDVENGVIKKFVYYYSKIAGSSAPKVEIEYKNVSNTPHFSKDEFSERQYVRIAGNKAIPVEGYKDYNISFNRK